MIYYYKDIQKISNNAIVSIKSSMRSMFWCVRIIAANRLCKNESE